MGFFVSKNLLDLIRFSYSIVDNIATKLINVNKILISCWHRYIEGDITKAEMVTWLDNFDSIPAPLTEEEKGAFLQTLTGVSISSDAFFPFR